MPSGSNQTGWLLDWEGMALYPVWGDLIADSSDISPSSIWADYHPKTCSKNLSGFPTHNHLWFMFAFDSRSYKNTFFRILEIKLINL